MNPRGSHENESQKKSVPVNTAECVAERQICRRQGSLHLEGGPRERLLLDKELLPLEQHLAIVDYYKNFVAKKQGVLRHSSDSTGPLERWGAGPLRRAIKCGIGGRHSRRATPGSARN